LARQLERQQRLQLAVTQIFQDGGKGFNLKMVIAAMAGTFTAAAGTAPAATTAVISTRCSQQSAVP